MARLPILLYPDTRLYKKASPVGNIDAAIRTLVADMTETMYAAPGIGLAATQVDVHKQIIVIDVSETRDQPIVLINPEISGREGIQNIDEGCLSVPDIYEPIERAQRITVRALDGQGKAFSLDAEGLLAVCVQHEMDHLEGKVFVDYLSRLKRTRIIAKLLKQQKKRA